MVFRYFNIGSIPPQPASQHPLYEHEIEMKCCEVLQLLAGPGGRASPRHANPDQIFWIVFHSLKT